MATLLKAYPRFEPMPSLHYPGSGIENRIHKMAIAKLKKKCNFVWASLLAAIVPDHLKGVSGPILIDICK